MGTESLVPSFMNSEMCIIYTYTFSDISENNMYTNTCIPFLYTWIHFSGTNFYSFLSFLPVARFCTVCTTEVQKVPNGYKDAQLWSPKRGPSGANCTSGTNDTNGTNRFTLPLRKTQIFIFTHLHAYLTRLYVLQVTNPQFNRLCRKKRFSVLINSRDI